MTIATPLLFRNKKKRNETPKGGIVQLRLVLSVLMSVRWDRPGARHYVSVTETLDIGVL